MRFLEDLQKLPEQKRKIILWIIIIIVAILSFTLWLRIIKKGVENFPKEQFLRKLELPEMPEEILKTPGVNLPELSEEELREFENLIEQEQQQKSQEIQQ